MVPFKSSEKQGQTKPKSNRCQEIQKLWVITNEPLT